MEPQMQGNMKDRDIRGAALPIPPLGKTPVQPQRWTSNPGRHATSAPTTDHHIYRQRIRIINDLS